MRIDTATARIAKLVDDYAASGADAMMGVATDDPEDAGVPPEMRADEVDPEGWVAWRVLPSVVSLSDVSALEAELGVRMPVHLKAYLLARSHLFDCLRSGRHGQQLMMSSVPANAPLQPIAQLVRAWHPLTKAGYLPFAEWGDGWGPVCLDIDSATDELEDAPVLWFDHEVILPLGEAGCSDRALVSRHAQPLYDSFLACLADVFDAEPCD